MSLLLKTPLERSAVGPTAHAFSLWVVTSFSLNRESFLSSSAQPLSNITSQVAPNAIKLLFQSLICKLGPYQYSLLSYFWFCFCFHQQAVSSIGWESDDYKKSSFTHMYAFCHELLVTILHRCPVWVNISLSLKETYYTVLCLLCSRLKGKRKHKLGWL